MKKAILAIGLFAVSGCVDNSNAALGYNELLNKNYVTSINYLKMAVAENKKGQLSIENLAWAYQNTGDYEKSANLYFFILNNLPNCRMPDSEDTSFKNKPISDLIIKNLKTIRDKLKDKTYLDRIDQLSSRNFVPNRRLKRCV